MISFKYMYNKKTLPTTGSYRFARYRHCRYSHRPTANDSARRRCDDGRISGGCPTDGLVLLLLVALCSVSCWLLLLACSHTCHRPNKRVQTHSGGYSKPQNYQHRLRPSTIGMPGNLSPQVVCTKRLRKWVPLQLCCKRALISMCDTYHAMVVRASMLCR